MKNILISAVVVLLSVSVFAQSAATLVGQGKALEKQRKETEALFKYKAALKLEPNNYEALKGACWTAGRVGFRIADVTKKKTYFEQALTHGKKLYSMKPKDPDACYFYCFAIGRLAQISSSKQRVAYIKDIERLANEALAIDPNHARAHHALGILYYRVANLSAVEKAAANLVLGGLPKGSNSMSLSHLIPAIKGDPNYILYRRDIAFTLLKLKQKDKAIIQLKKAISLPIQTEDDPGYIRTCKALLNKLGA